jgi:hypothetical protein
LLKTIITIFIFTPLVFPQQSATQTTTGGASQGQTSGTQNPSNQGNPQSPSNPIPVTSEPEPARPAMAPLSGADVFTPTGRGGSRSYVIPSIQFTGYASTNPTGSSSDVSANGSFLGTITLQDMRKDSQTNLDYAGGAFLYSGPIHGTQTIHRLNVTEYLRWRRWGIQLSDQLMYIPESPFGFVGFGGLGSLGLGTSYLNSVPGLSPILQPNQTILTGNARRLSNSAVVQLQYSPTGRSAFTVTADYGTLHFLDSGFIDSNYWTIVGGYNYALTRHDFVAITYVQTTFQLDVNSHILTRGFQAQYGRKLSARLNLQLSAGPIFNRVTVPSAAPFTGSSWSTLDSLQYRLSEKSDWGIFFSRYTSAGSGVLVGAESDWAQFTFDRRLSRNYYGSATTGYARNRSLTGQAGTNGGYKFDSWQGGFNLSRQFGRFTSVYVNYTLQRQISDQPVCFGSGCRTGFLRHVVGLGVDWHGKPMRLQ